jgi:Protein of unknown function (DUF3142)
MARSPRNFRLLLLALPFAAFCAHSLGDRDPFRLSAGAHFPGAMPRIVLWAWEEPEDLRSADPQRLGVAFLAERVFIGDRVRALPRRQPILVPQCIWAEAVVRLEASDSFHDEAATRIETVDAILTAAHLPGIRAVQIDFDATPAQRPFYAEVLRQVRAGLPTGERLEMTALVSWCSQREGWLRALPVDAAIPMEFRLGRHVGNWGVREPLCAGAIGVSTDEPSSRPTELIPNQITYVFAPRPFTAEQLALLNQGKVPNNAKGAR